MYDGIKICRDCQSGRSFEDGCKTGKVTKHTALRSNGKSTRISDMNAYKGKVEEVSMITATHMRSASQRKYQSHNVNQEKFPRLKFRKTPKVFTPLRKSQTQLY